MSASHSVFRVVECAPPAIGGAWLLYHAAFHIPLSTVEVFALGLSLVASTVSASALGRARIKVDHETEEALADLRRGAAGRDEKIAALECAIQTKDAEAERLRLLQAIEGRHGRPVLRLATTTPLDRPGV